ncbi:MAG: 16S rRNA (cytidine(1402)-2'-O)-methyltransferase [Lachnospiraceae bacterium]|nr:16S rRNA (cytidine(1402)-2'-O)-methyltransferase [Lachnospiraceae bacterium]
MAGLLYLCPTPIGNLSDISKRVLSTLNEVDLIAAEDTRNSMKLMNAFDIHVPMTSYHEYNKTQKAYELIDRLKEGKNIALITDAGTPGISDPGEVLVRMCHDEGITVTSLPGPCACIVALTLSGLPTRRFCFEGFLPADKKERNEVLEDLKKEYRTIVLYEAPHHLKNTLSELKSVLGGDRKAALCRELTKKFEEVMRFTLSEACEYYDAKEPKGEYVLVIEGIDRNAEKEESKKSWMEISVREHMQHYLDSGIDKKEAMKKVAKDRGIPKNEVYRELLSEDMN